MSFAAEDSEVKGTIDPIRRSSNRSIKRRKFDDELVESSLSTSMTGMVKPSRVRTQSASVDIPSCSSAADPQVEYTPLPETGGQRPRRPAGKSMHGFASAGPSSSSRKRKINKHNLSTSYKDLGRWKPTDDLQLIQGVVQTSDLRAVYQGVKFTCKFTFNEIAQRWYALIYDRTVSRVALAAIRNLQQDVIAYIESKCLYSEAEEALLASIKSTTPTKFTIFDDLFQKNKHIFHRARTAKSLYVHWCMMKQHFLLCDQMGTERPISVPTLSTNEERNNAMLTASGGGHDLMLQRTEQIPTFGECEELLNDSELVGEVKDPGLDKQLALIDRLSKKEIRMLDDDLTQIQNVSASIPGINPIDIDPQTLAVLRGRCVRFLMRSREITLGRKTNMNNVDVDLSLEGPAWKVSRKQASIRVKNSGEFFISNEGKRPIYVDGRPVLLGNKRSLSNQSVLEIAGLRFIFFINFEFLNSIIRKPSQPGGSQDDQPASQTQYTIQVAPATEASPIPQTSQIHQTSSLKQASPSRSPSTSK